jgi:hypothetical protein
VDNCIDVVCGNRSFWQACDFFGFRLTIDYPTIPIPRERDHLLIDLFHQFATDWDTDDFISWNRCRIACLALFLSDIVTADGRAIDPRYLDGSVMQDPPLSAYDFGQERPREADWEVWRRFWQEYTFPGYTLSTHLGPWICSSHRPNEWYHNPTTDTLFRRTAGGGTFYKRSSTGRSRSQQIFDALGPSPSIPDLSDFVPVCVTRQGDGSVNLGATGPPRYDPPPIQHDLFSLLNSWGGQWMWEHIKVFGKLDSVIMAIRNGTAIWCTDGSFDRIVMPTTSSSGWVIFDPLTKHHIRGAFYEDSGQSASAYRGELLGLVALHLVASAIVELYGPTEVANTMFCDNQRALEKAKWYRRRISPSSKHSDLLRLLRNLKPGLKGMFKYVHIYGHADKKRTWSQLSLPEKINMYCDYLAGQSRRESIGKERDTSSQVLPREKAALFLQSIKQTSDISEPARFFLARTQARLF